MKKLLPFFILFFAFSAQADVTASWTPGAVVVGTPVDEWLIFCAPVAGLYPSPIVLPEPARDHTFSVPDGATKCKMQSRSINHVWGGGPLDSEDSVEVIFLVAGGVVVDPRPNAPSLVVN